MTAPAEHNEPAGTDPQNHAAPSARAVLLRAAADHELTATQSVALAEHLSAHPDDARVIEFERRLREEVATLSGRKASDALRDRIGALAASQGDDALSPLGRIESRGGSQTRRWLAIAASLVIVAGGGYAVVQTLQSGVPHSAPVAMDDSYRASLVSFVRDFNEQCELHTERAMSELKITAIEEAPAAFATLMGRSIGIGSISIPAFHFLGGGPCSVPGGGKSFHLVFESDETDAARCPVVSLFIQQDTGEMKIDPGQTFRLTPKSGDVTPAYSGDIYVWRKDGFVYFLVSTSQTGLSATLDALGVEPPTKSI